MSQETLEKVFARDRFSIPSYQRDYAWGRKNFEDLWEDLQEAIDSKEKQGHFLGTLVVSPNKDDKSKFDIIDGQQRMTTIFMLLNILIDRSEFKETYRTKFLLDKRNNPKIELIPKNQAFLKECLEESKKNHLSKELKNKADTQGKENIYEVCSAILDEVSKLLPNEVEKYIDTLLSMLLMWLEEPNSGRAIRTFQSVNDRGVPLKLLDKLKALLMYYSNAYCNGENNSLDERINTTFGDIFKIFLKVEKHEHISNIGNQQFSENDIFRYHAGSMEFDEIGFFGHYRSGNEVTYETMKGELKKLKESPDKLAKFIATYIEDLKKFYQAFLELLDNINKNSNIFKLFLLEKINPYFYNTLVRAKINNDLDDRLIILIAKADILFFKSRSSKDATAYNLIHKYLKCGKETMIDELIKQCKSSDVKIVIEDAIQDAYEVPYFHYVFFEKNCKDMDINLLVDLIERKQLTQEKEHIIPYNIYDNENEEEAKKFGFSDLEDFGNFMNSYGNLLSLEKSLNSKAKDRDLLDKAEVYKDSKILFIRRFDIKNFNKEKLIERNKEFEKWLRDEFFKEFLD